MDIEELKFLTLYELVEAHLDPLRMTEELQEQILRSFLFICREKKLVENISGETFYPIPYQEITERIYGLDFEFSEELNSVIECLIEPLKKLLALSNLTIDELQLPEHKLSFHMLNAYKRFVSHIQLAVCQKKFIANQTLDVILQFNELKQENKRLKNGLKSSALRITELTAQLDTVGSNLSIASKQAQDALGDAQKAVYQVEEALVNAAKASTTVEAITLGAQDISIKVEQALANADEASQAANKALIEANTARIETETTSKNIITQFVTILGIFASIIIALFGGMSLVKAAVELLTNEGSLPVFVFAVSILLLSFTLLIMLLTSWILALNTKNDRNYNLFKVGMIVILLSVIGISSLVIITK